MKPIQVPAPKLEDVISEREYVLTWYFCSLKVDDELTDYNCKDADGFPNCTTCDYQIKINEEIQKNYEEIMRLNSEFKENGDTRPLEETANAD